MTETAIDFGDDFEDQDDIAEEIECVSDANSTLDEDYAIPIKHIDLVSPKSHNASLDKLRECDLKRQSPTPTERSVSISEQSEKSEKSEKSDLTSDRVGRILGFLKTVQQESRNHTYTSELPIQSMSDFLKDPQHPPSDTANAVFDGVKAKIVGQQMDIEEKSRTIEFLKNELKKSKEAYKDHVSSSQKSLKSQLGLQRKEYETIVKRHLGFMDKLLAEKEELTTQSQALSGQVKQLEKSFQDKARQLEEKQERDLKQQRELWQAAEKLRRDKWIQEKTKAIKDQTVKGLEPEIQRMIAQHKIQTRQLEEKFRETLMKEKQSSQEETQRQLEVLRDRAVADRQKACEEEREFARQRYTKQLERDELEFQQQKRKQVSDFDEEKHHLVENFKRERQVEESSHRKAIEDLKRQGQAEKDAKEQLLDETRRRHSQELLELREKVQIEKEEWQTHYMKKIETEMKSREKAFKEKLIKERDAEIELIVTRIEVESNSSTSDIGRHHRLALEKLKSEHAEEMKSLRDQHSMALDKVLASQAHIATVEENRREVQKQVLKLQHELAIKDGQLRQQKSELARLKVDEETLTETLSTFSLKIESEFLDDLEEKQRLISNLSREIEKMKLHTSQVERDFQKDLDFALAQKDASISEIEDNVMQAFKSKDSSISQLESQEILG